MAVLIPQKFALIEDYVTFCDIQVTIFANLAVIILRHAVITCYMVLRSKSAAHHKERHGAAGETRTLGQNHVPRTGNRLSVQ